MKIHPYDKLTLDNGASFLLTPCPGTKDIELKTSINQLQTAGTQAIITLMYSEEISTLGAQSLPELSKELGLKWFQLPILDDNAPNHDFEKAFKNNLSEILNILNNQGVITVHCKGGSGRTGLVIGLLMIQLGYKKEKIIEKIQNLRPNSLKHPKQITYFNNFKKLTEIEFQ